MIRCSRLQEVGIAALIPFGQSFLATLFLLDKGLPRNLSTQAAVMRRSSQVKTPVYRVAVLVDVIRPASVRQQSHRRRSKFAQRARGCLAALVAFLVSAVLLNQIIPSPTIPPNIVFIGPKYAYYKQHKDNYNALFFGSSRVYNQIVPAVFDTTAQSSGKTINSYNFGVPAMRALDSSVFLAEVLSNPPKGLKWVFFETILDKGYEPIPNARTPRAMYWHTWENTRLAARYILTSEASIPEKAVLFSSHLLPAIYRQLNVGRLFYQVLPSTFSVQEQAVADAFTAADGYYGLQGDDDPKRQHFLANQSTYLRSVQTLENAVDAAERGTEKPQLASNKRLLLDRVSRAVRAAGATPIFIEPPALEPSLDFRAAQQLGAIDTLLTYKDPQQHADLYQLSWRYDEEHLTAAASREFTRRLAKDFVAAVNLDQ